MNSKPIIRYFIIIYLITTETVWSSKVQSENEGKSDQKSPGEQLLDQLESAEEVKDLVKEILEIEDVNIKYAKPSRDMPEKSSKDPGTSEVLSGEPTDQKFESATASIEFAEPIPEVKESTGSPELLPTPTQKPSQETEASTSEADRLYEEAMNMLQQGDIRLEVRKKALKVLSEAAALGHLKAQNWIVLGQLLGWTGTQSLSQTFSELKTLADQGNPRGQFGLGFMYTSGLSVNASIPHALVHLTFAALGGDELAEMALGYRYFAGINLEEDCESALTHYQHVAHVVFQEVSKRNQAVGTVFLNPMVRRARLIDEIDSMMSSLDSGGDLAISEDLFQYYQFMADKKNVSAMVGLGQLYYYGRHGVQMDHKKAFYYFNLAAESGSSVAMAFLGEMYLAGNDEIPADPIKALSYLRRSVEDNNPIGLTALGMAYLYGRARLSVNPVTALELFMKAADQGWPDAQLQLGRLFLGEEEATKIKKDNRLALKYLTLASQQGNVLAFYYLGKMHAQGIGVIRSCPVAAELFKNVAERGSWSKWFMYAYSAFREQRYYEAFVTYQLLAELGYEVAQSNVAFMLEEVNLPFIPSSERHKRAFIQWQRSATQGSSSSRVKLGDYFYHGYGTEPDYIKAIQQYKIASDLYHNPQAMFNLAFMHEQGLGLKHDLYLAKRFYDMAAEASTDARVAVQLALMRLWLYFGMEYMKEWRIVKFFNRILNRSRDGTPTRTTMTTTTGSSSSPSGLSIEFLKSMDWDYYVIPLLTGLLVALLCYIRLRRV